MALRVTRYSSPSRYSSRGGSNVSYSSPSRSSSSSRVTFSPGSSRSYGGGPTVIGSKTGIGSWGGTSPRMGASGGGGGSASYSAPKPAPKPRYQMGPLTVGLERAVVTPYTEKYTTELSDTEYEKLVKSRLTGKGPSGVIYSGGVVKTFEIEKAKPGKETIYYDLEPEYGTYLDEAQYLKKREALIEKVYGGVFESEQARINRQAQKVDYAKLKREKWKAAIGAPSNVLHRKRRDREEIRQMREISQANTNLENLRTSLYGEQKATGSNKQIVASAKKEIDAIKKAATKYGLIGETRVQKTSTTPGTKKKYIYG